METINTTALCDVRHIGYAVCEGCAGEDCFGYFVPLQSAYTNKREAEHAATRQIIDLLGCPPSEPVHLYPVSQAEKVYEMMEQVLNDAPGGKPYQLCDDLHLVPGAAQAARADEREHYEGMGELHQAANTRWSADDLTETLESAGYPSAYSRGNNVWCNSKAGKGDKFLASLGMRWANKRQQWYYATEDYTFEPMLGKGDVSYSALELKRA